MSNAKKASGKSPSIVDDEDAMVDKIAQDIQPAGGQAQGPNPELGLTAVADRSALSEAEDEGTVRMVSADGVEADVDAANVKIHERSGWKRLKEDEA